MTHSNSAAAASSQRCHLLELPAELRNRVYAYALYHDRENGIFGTTAILRACRQIYDEAGNIIYEVGIFSLKVETVPTLSTVSDSIGASPAHRTTTVLSISGDLECSVSAESSEYRPSVPAPGSIYDSLQAKIPENFIYALACILNISGVRCKELTIVVIPTGHATGPGTSYDAMLYGLAKVPASVKITLEGVLRRSIWYHGRGLPPGIEVTHKFLCGDRAHPDAPESTKLNTIVSYKRVAAMVQPYLRSYERAFECDGIDCEHFACHTYESPWLWQRLERILESVRDRIELGIIPLDDNALLGAKQDRLIMADLELLETWGSAVVARKRIDESSAQEDVELYREYLAKRNDYSKVAKWEESAQKEVDAEIKRIRAARG